MISEAVKIFQSVGQGVEKAATWDTKIFNSDNCSKIDCFVGFGKVLNL